MQLERLVRGDTMQVKSSCEHGDLVMRRTRAGTEKEARAMSMPPVMRQAVSTRTHPGRRLDSRMKDVSALDTSSGWKAL